MFYPEVSSLIRCYVLLRWSYIFMLEEKVQSLRIGPESYVFAAKCATISVA